jgi:hypothetical protein
MKKASWDKTELTLLKKVRNKFRYGLVLQAVTNQLNRIGIRFTPYYWVQEGINDTDIPEIKGNGSDYTLGFLEAEEIKNLGNNPWGDSVKKQLADLNAGKKCLGLKYKDEIASFMWISFNECSFKPAWVLLKDDEAYLSYMYTMESFRGKNLAPYLRYRSYEFLKKMGRDKIYSTTEYFNPSASRYKEKLNAKKIKLVLFIEIFKKFKRSIILKRYGR